MKTALLRVVSSPGIFFLSLLTIALTALPTRGDQIDMKNGDHYTGKVTALDDYYVVLNSEILGTLRLSRDKVTAISFAPKEPAAPAPAATTSTAPNPIPKPPAVGRLTAPLAGQYSPNVNPKSASALRQQIVANSNLVNQVQTEVLKGAGPKAAKKYEDLIGGLSDGSIDIPALRKQAESVAAQLRQLRGSEDDETGGIFDEYLSVLDSFLQETKSVAPPTKQPNAPKTFKPTPAPSKAQPTAIVPKDDGE